MHVRHKLKYLKVLKKEYQVNQIIISELKLIYDDFFNELDYIKKKFKINLDFIREMFENELDFLGNIIDNDNYESITLIDIENIRDLMQKGEFQKHVNFFNDYNNCNTFLEKIKFLKKYFPDLVIDEKNIIESEENTKIREIINLNIIPLNDEYYLNNIFYIFKDSLVIEIFKDISKNKEHFEYKIILSHKIDMPSSDIKIFLTENNNKENEFIFFILCSNNIMKIIINNINNNYKCNIANYKTIFDGFINKGLIHLDINKNILFISNNNNKSQICIYNDEFKNEKILKKIDGIIKDNFKISQNTFAFSIPNKITILKLENENIIERDIVINKSKELSFICFNQKENLLLSLGKEDKKLYLINYNIINPEVIQILDFDGINYSIMKYHYYFCEEECIYFSNKEEHLFYDILYLSKFKIVEGELKKISKIEISKRKKKLIGLYNVIKK